MSRYRVQIRVNVRPDVAGLFVDHVAPLIRGTPLKLRNGSPGLIEGEGLTLSELGVLLSRVGALSEEPGIAQGLPPTGIIDDVWVHVSKQ
ncbi:MAG: hypothetical protein ACREJO_14110 [Phycisphaerales bacterium]